jgi:hypothetical protein
MQRAKPEVSDDGGAVAANVRADTGLAVDRPIMRSGCIQDCLVKATLAQWRSWTLASNIMAYTDSESIRARIADVARRDMELSDAIANDVAFHMTDWLDDLNAYTRFCADPNSLSDEEVSKLLMGFLVHVPNHLAAAAKLYTGMPVTDIFGVKAVSENVRDIGE